MRCVVLCCSLVRSLSASCPLLPCLTPMSFLSTGKVSYWRIHTFITSKRGVWDEKKFLLISKSGLCWQKDLGVGCTLSDLGIQEELSLHPTQRHTFVVPRKRWSLTPYPKKSHLRGVRLGFFLLKYCENGKMCPLHWVFLPGNGGGGGSLKSSWPVTFTFRSEVVSDPPFP